MESFRIASIPPLHHVLLRVRLGAPEEQFYQSALAQVMQDMQHALQAADTGVALAATSRTTTKLVRALQASVLVLRMTCVHTQLSDRAVSNALLVAAPQQSAPSLSQLMASMVESDALRVEQLLRPLCAACIALAQRCERAATSCAYPACTPGAASSSLSAAVLQPRVGQDGALFRTLSLLQQCVHSIPSSFVEGECALRVKALVSDVSACVVDVAAPTSAHVHEYLSLFWYKLARAISDSVVISRDTYAQEFVALKEWKQFDIASVAGMLRLAVWAGDLEGALAARNDLHANVISPLLHGKLRVQVFVCLTEMERVLQRIDECTAPGALVDRLRNARRIDAALVSWRHATAGLKLPKRRPVHVTPGSGITSRRMAAAEGGDSPATQPLRCEHDFGDSPMSAAAAASSAGGGSSNAGVGFAQHAQQYEGMSLMQQSASAASHVNAVHTNADMSCASGQGAVVCDVRAASASTNPHADEYVALLNHGEEWDEDALECAEDAWIAHHMETPPVAPAAGSNATGGSTSDAHLAFTSGMPSEALRLHDVAGPLSDEVQTLVHTLLQEVQHVSKAVAVVATTLHFQQYLHAVQTVVAGAQGEAEHPSYARAAVHQAVKEYGNLRSTVVSGAPRVDAPAPMRCERVPVDLMPLKQVVQLACVAAVDCMRSTGRPAGHSQVAALGAGLLDVLHGTWRVRAAETASRVARMLQAPAGSGTHGLVSDGLPLTLPVCQRELEKSKQPAFMWQRAWTEVRTSAILSEAFHPASVWSAAMAMHISNELHTLAYMLENMEEFGRLGTQLLINEQNLLSTKLMLVQETEAAGCSLKSASTANDAKDALARLDDAMRSVNTAPCSGSSLVSGVVHAVGMVESAPSRSRGIQWADMSAMGDDAEPRVHALGNVYGPAVNQIVRQLAVVRTAESAWMFKQRLQELTTCHRLPTTGVEHDVSTAASERAELSAAMQQPTVTQQPTSALQCGICLSAICRPVLTPCAHLYCRDCLLQWYRGRNVVACPLCKQSVAAASLYHVSERVVGNEESLIPCSALGFAAPVHDDRDVSPTQPCASAPSLT
ncbi:MAG: hypothetical protein EOO65_01330, partial [Methanosarcinales archaeon]